MRAYFAGVGPEPQGHDITAGVALVLNDYHLRNLRWLLRHAWHGTHDGINLNTGDWNGEVLWAIEQALMDSDAGIHANAGGDPKWTDMVSGWGAPTRTDVFVAPAEPEGGEHG